MIQIISGYHTLYHSEIYTSVLKDALLHAVEDIVKCIQTGKHQGVQALMDSPH